MSSQESKLEASDAELIECARSGDSRAFGELWTRHYRSAARVARQCTSSIDADDLVSEAYARIYQRVLAGGGPDGAFRPYLYTTIRNLAATWGAQQSRDVQVDLIDDFEDDRIPDDPAAWALDRTLTARAFRSLPERWQTVLWYTEVEGMDPHEVAPILGITANSVAALSYRAREGLRKAWLQAHINDAQASGECQFVMGKLGEHSRNGLGDRDRKRVDEHLATCPKCSIVSEEVEEVGSHLAFILIPLVLGGVVGGGVLAAMAAPSTAMAATAAAAAVPALPAAVHAVGAVATASAAVSTPAVVGGLSFGAAAGSATLVGSLAVAAVLGGGIAVGITATTPDLPTIAPPTAAQQLDPQQAQHLLDAPAAATGTAPAAATGVPGDGSLLAPVTGGTGQALGGIGGTVSQTVGGVGQTVDGLGQAVGGVVGGVGQAVGGPVGGVVSGVGQTVGGVVSGVGQTLDGTQPVATVNLDLSGTGTPGATVSAQVAGTVYTTVIAKNGAWALHISGLPQGTGSAKLSQSLGGLVGGLLGAVGITVPLSLDVAPLGISIDLLN